MGFSVWGLFRKEPQGHVASCSVGFDCPIFVGVDTFAYTRNGSACWSKVGFCLGLANFTLHGRHAFYLSRMGMVRDAGYLWGREGSVRGTNIFRILQEVSRQNIRIWGTRALAKRLFCGET